MKSYRRNWMIGMIIALVGVVLYVLTQPSFLKTASGYIIGAGLVLAGWFGRIWVFEERQGKLAKVLKPAPKAV